MLGPPVGRGPGVRMRSTGGAPRPATSPPPRPFQALERGHRSDVDRDDSARHPDPADPDEARLAHDLGDPLRRGVGLDAADEVGVGVALARDPPDDGHDPVEPPAQEPGQAAARAGDLQADDLAAGTHDARHLREPPPVVGEVAHAEGDRGCVEALVLGRQGHRVAHDERKPGPTFISIPGDADHPRAEVHAEDLAAGLSRRVEIGRDLAGAGRDVDRPAAGLQGGERHGAPPPARLLEGADGEVHGVVDAADPVEHRADLGRGRGVAALRREAGGRRGGGGIRDGRAVAGQGRHAVASTGWVVMPASARASRTAAAIAAGSVIGAVWRRPGSSTERAPGMWAARTRARGA